MGQLSAKNGKDGILPYVLTLVAARDATVLTQAMIDRVRDAVGGGRTPRLLSPGEAADIGGLETDDLIAARAALEGAPVDALMSREHGRRRRLLVADMDSTIVTGETLDELASRAGAGEAVAEITRRSMNGEVDFREALRLRVRMLKGVRLAALEETWREVRLTQGARTLVATMRAAGAMTALVSGGFTFFTSRVAELCGFDHHHANVLLDDGAALTGEVSEPILGQDTKLQTMRSLALAAGVRRTATLALGDGANDLAMLKAAGLGIAYHAKPVVAAEISNRIEYADLRAVLFAQGFSLRAFVEQE
jgi:phosphoserine phosphatase